MKNPRRVLEKIPKECWARARCPSPLEVKNKTRPLLRLELVPRGC